MKMTMTKYVFAAVAAASMLTAATATADTTSRTVRIAAVNYAGGDGNDIVLSARGSGFAIFVR